MEYYEKVGLVSLDFNKISIPVLALCTEDDPLCRGECKLNLKIYILCITLRRCVKFILERRKRPKLKYSPLKFLLPFCRSASKSRHLLYKTIFFFFTAMVSSNKTADTHNKLRNVKNFIYLFFPISVTPYEKISSFS